MSVSTNGQICYGVLFEEDFEFPWSDERYDGDIENWWIEEVNGFKHSFEVFTENGDWIGGKEPDDNVMDKYYQEKTDFEKSMPKLPVELVNVQSAEYPVYILAVAGTDMTANRGDPQVFQPHELSVDGRKLDSFHLFMVEHLKMEEYDSKWYLSSYWG